MAFIPKTKTCPKCSKQMTLPTGNQLPKAVKCPHCASILQVQPKPKDTTNTTTPKPSTPQQHIREANQVGVPQTVSSVGRAVGDSHLDEFPDNNTKQPPPESIPTVLPVNAPIDEPLTIVHNRAEYTRRQGLTIRPSRALLLVFLTIYVLPMFCFFVLAHILAWVGGQENNALPAFGMCPCFLWFWSFPLLFIVARYVTAAFVTQMRCKGCGLDIPCTNRWSIGQWQDHKERHVLLVRSPLDGSRIGHTNCPACDSTLFV